MELNATLFGQMITFGIFVWFTMKFIWPGLEKTLEQRKKIIADGLAAAEIGQKKLDAASDEALLIIQQAKERSRVIIANANIEANEILETAKLQAKKEREEIVAAGNAEVDKITQKVKKQLQTQMAKVVVMATEKILDRSVNIDDHKNIIDKISQSMAS